MADDLTALVAELRRDAWILEGDKEQHDIVKRVRLSADAITRLREQVAVQKDALDALRGLKRHDVQNGPDCPECDERGRACDCAEPKPEIVRGVYVLSSDLDAALALASKAEEERDAASDADETCWWLDEDGAPCGAKRDHPWHGIGERNKWEMFIPVHAFKAKASYKMTIGDLRREIANLHDDCEVNVSVEDEKRNLSLQYGDGIECEADSDGDVGWLTIMVTVPR